MVKIEFISFVVNVLFCLSHSLLTGYILAPKTSITCHFFFIEVYVPSQESEYSFFIEVYIPSQESEYSFI